MRSNMNMLAKAKKAPYILEKGEAQKFVKSKLTQTQRESIKENAVLFTSNNIDKNNKEIKNMTREEMIEFIRENPGVKVTHELFSANEYIYSTGHRVYDENGYLFEDWRSPTHNGLRMRTGGAWEDGWKIYKN